MHRPQAVAPTGVGDGGPLALLPPPPELGLRPAVAHRLAQSHPAVYCIVGPFRAISWSPPCPPRQAAWLGGIWRGEKATTRTDTNGAHWTFFTNPRKGRWCLLHFQKRSLNFGKPVSYHPPGRRVGHSGIQEEIDQVQKVAEKNKTRRLWRWVTSLFFC